MNGKKNWLGWIAIGMGGLALLVALFGRGFGPQMAAAGGRGFNAPQSYGQQDQRQQGNGQQRGPGANAQPGNMQQGNGQQRGQAGPGANAQPNNAQPNNAQPQQRGQAGPGANAQPGNMQQRGQQGNGQQRGQGGPGANAQRGGNGFGLGGWFRLPFRLFGGSFQIGMLGLLVVFGILLLRKRSIGGSQTQPAAPTPAAAPAPAPLSPTGESYTDGPSDEE